MIPHIRSVLAVVSFAVLGACGDTTTGTIEDPEPLGEFKLGYAIVVADNAQEVEPSRNVDPELWEAELKKSLEQRFSGHDGDQFYHVAVNVLGYSVAVPGIPVVLAPKSVVVVAANVWDDAAGGKINTEPRQFTVFESASPDLVIGSGLTKSKEEQVANLSANVARQIENWMRDNPDWFAQK